MQCRQATARPRGSVFTSVVACLVFGAPAALAQEAVRRPSSSALRQIDAVPFQTPIERQAVGLVTIGDRYVASFDGGFEFQTRLQDRSKSASLRWRTVGIRRGEVAVTEEFSTQPRHSKWRCEFDHGAGIVERYDVSKQGVEQSFWFPTRPAGKGDLLIHGAVTTDLRANQVVDQNREIVFADAAGSPVTSYGAAVAIDANGERLPVRTSWDGSRISLRVDGDSLDRAAFPLLVDPLLAPKVVLTMARGESIGQQTICIAKEDFSRSHNVIIGFERRYRRFSETRWYLCNDDFSGATLIRAYYDVRPTNWIFNTLPIHQNDRVAPVHGARRWVMAASQTQIYVHDFGNTTAHSGTVHALSIPRGVRTGAFAIGGTRRVDAGRAQPIPGTRAVVAFTLRKNASVHFLGSWPAYTVFDAKTKTFVTGTNLLDGVGSQRGTYSLYPRQLTVNQVNDGASTSPWLVVWRATTLSTPGRLHRGALVTPDGKHTAKRDIGAPRGGWGGIRVEGEGGRYMLAFEDVDVSFFGTGLRVRRIDWQLGASAPTVGAEISLVPMTQDLFTFLEDIAYDSKGGQHWAVLYTTFQRGGFQSTAQLDRAVGHVVRFDESGAVAERGTVFDVAGNRAERFGGSICFDRATGCFPIAYIGIPTSIGNYSVLGTKLCNTLITKVIGTGTGTISAKDAVIRSGRAIEARLADVVGGGSVTLLMGTELNTRVSTTLPIYVGGTVTKIQATLDAKGQARVVVPITANTPNPLYFQWLIAPPVNSPAPLRASPGLMVQY